MCTAVVHVGDARDVLGTFDAESVQTVVTSPPFWGLRDYGVDGQIGLEHAPGVYVERLIEVFREVRRVLRDDGSLWLQLGDTYIAGKTGGIGEKSNVTSQRNHKAAAAARREGAKHRRVEGLKAKDLVGIPWMVAFALRADGWFLRSEIIWHKRNPMPESVVDRPTRTHEHLFLLSKSERYYYDAAAIREPATGTAHPRGDGVNTKAKTAGRGEGQSASFSSAVNAVVDERNKRTVWSTVSAPYSGTHTATYPVELVVPCVLAGAPVGGVVLDPFAGACSTGIAAMRNGRSFVGIEISETYAEEGRARLALETAQTSWVDRAGVVLVGGA